jgi:hypothetical protein
MPGTAAACTGYILGSPKPKPKPTWHTAYCSLFALGADSRIRCPAPSHTLSLHRDWPYRIGNQTICAPFSLTCIFVGFFNDEISSALNLKFKVFRVPP